MLFRSATHHLDHLADTGHRHGFFRRVVACLLVNGDEIRPHGPDVIQEHVDHHLISGTARGNQVNQNDAVERAEMVVAYLNIEQKTENPSLSILLFLSLDSKLEGI